jgi:predicted LPLAT superfamily acyltransferase
MLLHTTPRAISHWESAWIASAVRRANRVLPRAIFDPIAAVVIWVVVVVFPRRRRNSRDFIRLALGRPAGWRDVWRHYRSFLTMQLLRLNVADGVPHVYRPAADCAEFAALMRSPRPALLGTFHLGNSDLLGFFLGTFRRHVHMVRFRLGDPGLLQLVARTCGAWVSFIWVNEKDDLLFALKRAIDSGGTVAMKCDRDGYSSRRETFRFLGAERSFPFTIYHLSVLFKRPVTFCICLPTAENESTIRGFPIFEPDDGSREANLARARVHFQGILTEVESVLCVNPFLWFNFDPLGVVTPEASLVSRVAPQRAPGREAAAVKRGTVGITAS